MIEYSIYKGYSYSRYNNPGMQDLSNIVLTPHIGGSTQESTIRMAIAAAEEVIRVLAGQAPKYPVILR